MIVNLRTLQIYVNNVNIIESATSSTQSTGFVGGSIGNVIEGIIHLHLINTMHLLHFMRLKYETI